MFRARMTVGVLLAIAVITSVNSIATYYIATYGTSAALAVITAVSIALLFALRRGVPQKVVATIIVVTAQIALSYSLWETGGLAATLTVSYLASIPVVTLALSGKEGARWSLVGVLIVMTMLLVTHYVPSLPQPPPLPQDSMLRRYVTEVALVIFLTLVSGFHVTINAHQRAALAAARDEANRANEAKSKFLANMSHELRTPMNGVLGLTQVLLRDASLNDEQRHLLNVVQGSGTSLVQLLNDILDLSKIEAGRIELEQVPFAPASLAEELHQLLLPSADSHDIALIIDDQGTVPVLGDPTRTRQVLMNLLGNAIKFTHNGHVTLRMIPGAGTLRFEVEDTGIGIPEAVQATIFEQFAQADTSTTRRFGGTGLGLTISRLLVERMGGTLDLQSSPGAGSTFGFSLPVSPAPHPPARDPLRPPSTAKPAPASPLVGLRVLVAEDNPVNQLVARSLLAELGITPRVVGTGEEAVRCAQDEEWDVILMDVHMPLMDGLTAARTLRAEGNATPILAMTASTMAEERAATVDAGMNGFLPKPVRLADLSIALHQWAPQQTPTP